MEIEKKKNKRKWLKIASIVMSIWSVLMFVPGFTNACITLIGYIIAFFNHFDARDEVVITSWILFGTIALGYLIAVACHLFYSIITIIVGAVCAKKKQGCVGLILAIVTTIIRVVASALFVLTIVGGIIGLMIYDL